MIKALVILTTIAICFQRLSMALGSLCWGLSIAIAIYILWEKNRQGKLNLLLEENEEYSKHIKLLGLLCLIMLWGVVFTDNVGKSAKEYAEMFLYRPFPFIISALILRETKYLKFILVCFGIVFCADCATCMYQKLTFAEVGWGFGGHHNNIGSITAILMPMLIIAMLDSKFSFKEKVFLGTVLSFNIIGSIGSDSRGSWVTIAFILPFVVIPYVLNNKKKFFICLLACVLTCGAVLSIPSLRSRVFSTTNTNTNYSNIGRFHMWNISMYMIKDHPLGVGAGRYAYNYTKYYDPVYATPKDAQHLNHPHNNYLKIWVEFGPLGILTYLYVCIAVLGYNIRYWIKTKSPYAMMAWSGWLAFLIYGLFDVIVDHSAVTKIWWFLLGAVLTLEALDKERRIL